jgi:lipopolysaccharide biosynthesis glycosyltransferase
MQKNAIVTVTIGSKYKFLSRITHPSIKSYAKRINADFVCIDGYMESTPPWQESPSWQKMQIYDLLDKYGRIIYIDTDMIVRKDCPNLFEVVPESKLGMFNEGDIIPNRLQTLADASLKTGIGVDKPGRYYNAGLIVVSSKHKEIFSQPEDEINSFYEQTYLNLMIQLLLKEDEIFDLDYRFNRMTCMDERVGISRLDSYIIHYAGCPSQNLMLNTVRDDLEQWGKDAPDFKYTRNIFIKVSGGMGDQMCAQPSIKRLLTDIYSNDNVIIETHYPEFFKHLTSKVYKHGEYINRSNEPFLKLESFPDVTTIMYAIIGTIYSHTVDLCSYSLLKESLTNENRGYFLPVYKEDVESVKKITGVEIIEQISNSVIIHAGKHWQTKTIPRKWWEDIIDGLTDKGIRVCLIGKTGPEENESEYSATCSAYDFKEKDNIINTVDKLNIKELITILSLGRVLLSNDSSPVHIAGAFDNWIYLIPSIKHPDHLFPMRSGSVDYKTKSFYKRLMRDDYQHAPHYFKTFTMTHIPEGYTWDDYLVKPSEVVESIAEFF